MSEPYWCVGKAKNTYPNHERAESGRPSVGIDLGYACTQPNPSSNRGSVELERSREGGGDASRSPAGQHQISPENAATLSAVHSAGTPPLLPSNVSPERVGGGVEASDGRAASPALRGIVGERAADSPGNRGDDTNAEERMRTSSSGGGAEVSSVSAGTPLFGSGFGGGFGGGGSLLTGHASSASPSALRTSQSSFSSSQTGSSHTRSPSGPPSPFIFQPPRTPSRQISPISPLRRSFVFSEWAASNKQTFVFEGAHQQDAGEPFGLSPNRRSAPCKFVPTKALTMAVQDANFVKDVLKELPGVDTSDPRIATLLDQIKVKRPTSNFMQRSGIAGMPSSLGVSYSDSLAQQVRLSLSPATFCSDLVWW